MRWTACLGLALLLSACAGGAAPEAAPTTTTTSAPRHPSDNLTTAEIAAWVARSWDETIATGTDPTLCVHRPSDVDDSGDSLVGNSWAFLQLPLIVEDLLYRDGATRPAIRLAGEEVYTNPSWGYDATHVFVRDSQSPMLDRLTEEPPEDHGVEVVLSFGETSLGREGDSPERPGLVDTAWLLTPGHVIPFAGPCAGVTAFRQEFGEPLETVGEIREDEFRRAEVFGLTENRFDFGWCGDEEPGLTARPGFGGPDIGFAFGPWPRQSEETVFVDVTDWTVVPPSGFSPPRSIHLDGTSLRPFGGVADGWFLTFRFADDRPVAVSMFHSDPVIGLHADTQRDDGCFSARQVLAFREALDGIEPDRERWQMPIGEPGDEQLVIETLERLRSDPAAQAFFHEWTPCTYKLCVLDGLVPPRRES